MPSLGLGLALGLGETVVTSGSGKPVCMSIFILDGNLNSPPLVGDDLTVNSTWTGSPTLTYQWTSGGVNIPGATATTYFVQNSDVGNSVGCTVTATNGAGSTQASASTGTVPAPAFPTANLLARFEPADIQSSGGTWTGWNDSSGNGFNITSIPSGQVVSSRNSRPFVRFNGSFTPALIPSAAFNSQSVSVIFVGRMWLLQTNAPTRGTLWQAPTDNISVWGWIYTPGGPARFNQPNGTKFVGANRSMIGVLGSATAETYLLDETTETESAFGAVTGTGISIGLPKDGAWPLAGDIEAIYVYGVALDSTTIAALKARISYAFNMFSRDVAIAMHGDSITAGHLGYTDGSDFSEGWPFQLADILGDYPYYNGGQDGANMATILSNASGSDTFLTGRSTIRLVSILHGGTNDFFVSGVSEATYDSIIADTQTWITDRQAAVPSGELYIGTMLPRPSLGDPTWPNALNTWIRGNTSLGYTVLDYAGLSQFATASTTYMDDTHPTQLGYSVMANYVKGVVGL